MSRSAFLKTNEISTATADRRFQHDLISSNRSNEILPIALQSSTNKSMIRTSRRIQRNLRDKRRSTGIRPDEVSLASTSTEDSANENEVEDEEDNNSTYAASTNDTYDHNRNLSSSKAVFTVGRIQSSLESISIPRTDPYMITSSPTSNIYSNTATTTKIFRPQEFIIRRVEKPTGDDASVIKCRQLEERIRSLESLLLDKDSIIYDLQRKLENANRDLADTEQQIYLLHQDKLTLIKTIATLQDDDPSPGDLSNCSNFLARN
ncbi:unnamed protein product [Adineta ricciae]|uniref:Uncharacterized protein n=1 Tax=Adineta ricciae TaxID=249248 RepID=A0A816GTM9_ADIRI|nr:unnamed protein product [Adineta ricciae]CAF1677434.1 unnamed protein product [Adineta ricciae]